MARKTNFWRKLHNLLPKKKIYIEGNVTAREQTPEQELEILEGEETPIRVYFDKSSQYEIIEREISPAKTFSM